MQNEAECAMKAMNVLNKKKYINVDEYRASVKNTYKEQQKLAYTEKLDKIR